MNVKQSSKALILALLLALLLTACGGQAEPTPTAVPETTSMEEEMDEPMDEEMMDEEMDESMDEEMMDEEMMAPMMIDVATVLATSNPGELADDAILGLSPDLSAVQATFAGFSEIASVESIDLAADGTAYLTVDLADGTGGLLIIEQFADSSGIVESGSRLIAGSDTGLTAPKGLQVVDELGIVLIADFGASDIKVFDAAAEGNVAPLATVTDLGEDGRKAWDIYHDGDSDTLYAAGTDGVALVYNNFSEIMGTSGPDNMIIPADASGNQISINLHGIVYTANTLILTDVGDAASATDGQLFTIPNVSEASGETAVAFHSFGEESLLGNPVDVVFDGTNAYVAEKSNDVVLRYDDILNRMDMGPVTADAMILVTKAESVALSEVSLADAGLTDEEMTMLNEMHMMADVTSATGAADLRIALTNLLGEHTLLAASATNAALDGRTADFEEAAAALDENTLALGAAIGSVYGPEAEEAFVPLWRSHIGFFVDYTNGAATGDEAVKEQAIEDLLGYRADFIAFLTGANPNLTEEALTEVLTPHVGTLTAVIDAQAAEDHEAAYEGLREAYGHMQMIAGPLSGAIGEQFPEQFDGNALSPAADLRTALNVLLAEHTYLAGMATNAALEGREAEFEAAAAALDQNTIDLGAAIGSVYGPDAEEAFVPLWRSHIGFFVNYTLGVAGGDEAMKEQAIDDLLGYRADFIAFLTSANPDLPEEALSEILTPHVGTLTTVIEAQGTADDGSEGYFELREAYGHMQMIADALAESIVQQFPENFAQ